LTAQNLAYKKLHHNGSGIRIGVIDSGIDYTHPALGGCFGVGCKVRYGYDLVGDDYNGDITTLKPDHDPLDNCGVKSRTYTINTLLYIISAAKPQHLRGNRPWHACIWYNSCRR
jgi:subtilisin family serine protease